MGSLQHIKLSSSIFYADKVMLNVFYADKGMLNVFYADKVMLNVFYADKVMLNVFYADKVMLNVFFVLCMGKIKGVAIKYHETTVSYAVCANMSHYLLWNYGFKWSSLLSQASFS